VIFVPVSNENRAKLVGALAYVGEIVDHDIDPVHLVVGKHQAAVDHDQVVVGLDDGHVPADLAAAAQRNDAHVWLARRCGNDQRVRVHRHKLSGSPLALPRRRRE